MTTIKFPMSGEVPQKFADMARLMEMQRKDDEPRMSAKMAAGEADREARVEAAWMREYRAALAAAGINDDRIAA